MNDNQLQVDIVFSPTKAEAQAKEFVRSAESIFAASEARRATQTSDSVRKVRQINGEYQDWWKRSLQEQSNFEKMLRQAQVEDYRRTLAKQVAEAKNAAKEIAAAQRANPMTSLGLRTLDEDRARLGKIRDAMTLVTKEYANGTRSSEEFAQSMRKLRSMENVQLFGDSRARSEVHRFLAKTASMTFELTGAFYGLTAAAGIVGAGAIFGTKSQMEIETAQMGITGILTSMGQVKGKNLEVAESWAISGKYIQKVRDDSIKYGVDMGKLTDVNRAVMAPLLSAGIKLPEIQKFATAGAVAVSALGLGATQFVQEVRDLATSGITASSSTLATSLGVTNKMINEWKKNGTFIPEMMARLEGFNKTSEEMLRKTLSGSWQVFQAKLGALMQDPEAFKGLVDAINSVTDAISSPAFKTGVEYYWAAIKGVGRSVRDLVAFLAEHRQAIITVAEAYVALRVISAIPKMFEAIGLALSVATRNANLFGIALKPVEAFGTRTSDAMITAGAAVEKFSNKAGMLARTIGKAGYIGMMLWGIYEVADFLGITNNIFESQYAAFDNFLKKVKSKSLEEAMSERQKLIAENAGYKSGVMGKTFWEREIRGNEDRIRVLTAQIDKLKTVTPELDAVTAKPGLQPESKGGSAAEKATAYSKWLDLLNKANTQYQTQIDNVSKLTESEKAQAELQRLINEQESEAYKGKDKSLAQHKEELLLKARLNVERQKEAELMAKGKTIADQLTAKKLAGQGEYARYQFDIAPYQAQLDETKAKLAPFEYSRTRREAGIGLSGKQMASGGVTEEEKKLLDARANTEKIIRDIRETFFMDSEARTRVLRAESETMFMDQREKDAYELGKIQKLIDEANAAKKFDDAKKYQDELDALAQVQSDREYKRILDSVSSAITQGIMQGFDNGSSALTIFANIAKDIFRNQVMRPLIDDLTKPLAEMMTGVTASLKNSFTSLFSNFGGAEAVAGATPWGAIALIGAAIVSSLGKNEQGTSPEQIQALQGIGTVLGDSNAKSQSLVHGIDMLNKYTFASSNYLISMKASLEKISNGIGSFVSVMARSGLGENAAAGMGISPYSNTGALLGLFSGSSRKINAQGIGLSGTLEDLQSGGGGYQYATGTDTTKALFGLYKSSKGWRKQQDSADVANAFADVFASMGESIKAAAISIGYDGNVLQKQLDAFVITTGDINLQNMTAEEKIAALNEIVAKQADLMVTALAPAMIDLQKAGEGLDETLIRIATEMDMTKNFLGIIGNSLFQPVIDGAEQSARNAKAALAYDVLQVAKANQTAANMAVENAKKAMKATNPLYSPGDMDSLVADPSTIDAYNQALLEAWVTTAAYTSALVAFNVAQGSAAEQFSISATAMDAFIEKLGGIDKANEKMNSFLQNFADDATLKKMYSDTLTRLGLPLLTTQQEWFAFSKTATEEQLAALLNNQGAVQGWLDQLGKTTEAVNHIRDALRGLIKEDLFRTITDFHRAQAQVTMGSYYGRMLPAFADGGYHTGGLALVGERGPEIVNMGPAHVSNASSTREMMNDSGTQNEVAAMRAELKAAMVALVQISKDQLKIQRQWDGEGMPAVRTV